MIIGYLLAGIGRNVILSGGPKTSSQWFFPKNTPIITSLFMATYPVGVILSYFIALAFIKEDTITIDGKKQFEELFTY